MRWSYSRSFHDDNFGHFVLVDNFVDQVGGNFVLAGHYFVVVAEHAGLFGHPVVPFGLLVVQFDHLAVPFGHLVVLLDHLVVLFVHLAAPFVLPGYRVEVAGAAWTGLGRNFPLKLSLGTIYKIIDLVNYLFDQ